MKNYKRYTNEVWPKELNAIILEEIARQFGIEVAWMVAKSRLKAIQKQKIIQYKTNNKQNS